MHAALFDMDRTLVRKETASLYVKYQRDRGEATRRDRLRVLWWVFQYTFGVVDAVGVAERLASPLAGTREDELARKFDEWFPDYVQRHVSPIGAGVLREHQRRGDFVAIVTGATRYGAGPLARSLGVEHVVGSELDVVDGLFTGRVELPLCYGQGKLERARTLAAKHGFDLSEATFYSDSYTDLPLLEAVRKPVIVNPDLRLRRLAKKRGWPIERW